MARKKKKILNNLYQRLSHDPMAYNPEWKWEWLPQETRENWELIRPKLLEWQKLGHITLVESEEIAFRVHSVPPQP